MFQTTLFHDHWFFTKAPLGAHKNDLVTWKEVELPHDWLIYNTHDLYETGEGWYTKNFYWDTLDVVLLRFEGVYMDTTVFVNDQPLFEWKYGYSSFEVNLTPALLKGQKNNITVRVVYQSPNSRWYSGAGIYRNIWLKLKESSYIASDSVYIHCKQENPTDWRVFVDATAMLHPSCANEKISLDIHVTHKQNGKTLYHQMYPMDGASFSTDFLVSAPQQWDIETPQHLYVLSATLYIDSRLIDTAENTFGFRTITFSPATGFSLNGRVVKLNGVCQHHDLGALGAAVNVAALRRQLVLLKAMGANAIRTAHNMPAVELMDLADEMGFLICSEGFDMWERSKTPYDYARFFPTWVEKDVQSWICRDRNHPSVILWSIGNEIYDTHVDHRGATWTTYLMNLVKQFDFRGNAPVTIGSNYMPWENAQQCADIVKIAGYNYAEKLYKPHHTQHPDWVVYGSETSSVVQSRGIYHFPLAQSVLSDDDEQCSALGNSAVSWGAKSMEHCIIDHRNTPFIAGQFIWTGTDYIGEPTPYATKNSYFGQIDTAGFPKDSFYFYQSQWTDVATNPMVHIFPYWDFSPHQQIDVRVCSNAPFVELFLNGSTLGKITLQKENGTRLIGDWQLPYEPGELKAVAYDKNGKIIATETKRSFTDATHIQLQTQKDTLCANGLDLAFVEITVVDKEGTPVENANNRMTIRVQGAGRLIGIDNGDSTDIDQYKGNSKRLFSGKLLAIIAPTYEPGRITIEVTSPGLVSQKLLLESVKTTIAPGQSTYLAHNTVLPEKLEVPIRKIEIVPERQHLTADHPTTLVKAICRPTNATYNDLTWRVTDAAGITSNRAVLDTYTSHTVRVTALGDGNIYLRCTVNNGADQIRLISQIELTVSGLGTPFLDPYTFVSGGLYSHSHGTLANGNDRGVATARDEESHVTFGPIDFGSFGSNELTLPIFSMDQIPFTFDLWEGIPYTPNSAFVATLSYEKGSRWNTYIEEVYTLPRRLHGVTSITFVFQKKVHLKGFIFRELKKAFERLYAASDANAIYGDRFVVEDGKIKNIGNNVTITFDAMDFGREGATKVTVYGKTPLTINTIQLRMQTQGGESNERIEVLPFDGCVEYTAQTFSLPQITGKWDVSLVFLPGAQFDLDWIQFA